MANRFGDEAAQESPAAVNRFGDSAAEAPKGSVLSRLGSSFWEGIGGRAAVDIMGGASRDPERAKKAIETVKGLVHGLANEPARVWGELSETGNSMAHGDIPGAVSHLGQSVPIVGAPAGQVQHDFENGDYASGFGHALGLILPFAAKAIPRDTGVKVAPKIVNPNPAETAAFDYLESKGAQIPAGARTGSKYVKGIQKAADSTPIGAVVAQGTEKANTGVLRAESADLATRANPTPVVPEQAGAGIRSTLTGKAAQYAADADKAYGDFRLMEQHAPMQVDIRGIKAQLKPIYDDMSKWMEPAKRNASAGFQAIKSILDGADAIPASQAEAGLGGLKQLAREGAGRNAGLAKYAGSELQKAIDGAVSSVDPGALDKLREGRSLTSAQYGTKAVLDDIRTEPVQAFGQMVYAKDAGIDMLRRVSAEAPGELPKVGRAWLEDLFGKAQSQGGFGNADSLFAKWRDLGPQTKKLLFQDPQLVGDLDSFFLGAKKLAENPNPSGSAVVGIMASGAGLIVTHPATGVPLMIGAGALSKMLHSPAGVRALTNGMKVPLKVPAAGLLAGQILKMAGEDVHPLPAAAQNPQTEQNDLAAAGPRR